MDRRPSLRNVLGFAREVRVHLYNNAAVIVGSTIPGADPTGDVFRILPWGTTSVVTIRLDEVSRAATVHGMTWHEQRMICTAQAAGVFESPPLLHAGKSGRDPGDSSLT
jgi:hypothetical protein